MYHRQVICKMDLIYVQTRVRSPGSPELALEMEDKD